MQPNNMNLRKLQTLLYQCITDPDGTNENVGNERGKVLEALVQADERLSTVERIDIYADAYFYRLLECLSEDFPATLAVLGADNFAALVKGYLLEKRPLCLVQFHSNERVLPTARLADPREWRRRIRLWVDVRH